MALLWSFKIYKDMNNNLIGISGKMNSGKDTVGKMIQILSDYPQMSGDRVIANLDKEMYNTKYEIKRFADKLKDCVCLIIGCTRQQLEDRGFKNTALGDEWNRVKKTVKPGASVWDEGEPSVDHILKMTPRRMLQLLGTEGGRKIIHPDIWVNATFADYKPLGAQFTMFPEGPKDVVDIFPNWLFTDMRFPNELKAIKKRGGITIRVNRTFSDKPINEHESETALDSYSSEFDYTIDNNSTLEELVEQVRAILEQTKIITNEQVIAN
jgi:dephospho-CoA kinase